MSSKDLTKTKQEMNPGVRETVPIRMSVYTSPQQIY